MKGPVYLEEALIDRLVERAWSKYGSDSNEGWENWLLEHWPKRLSLGYYHYLLGDLDDIPWVRLWSPALDPYEFHYWLFKGRRWRWMFEETKLERIRCRWRGHPRGEIYYNPGGYEPDHRCKDCGEEIG